MSELTTPFWVACADCDPLADVQLAGVQEYDTWIRNHRETTGHRNHLSATSRAGMDRQQAPYRRLIERSRSNTPDADTSVSGVIICEGPDNPLEWGPS